MYKKLVLLIALSCTAGCASIPDRSPDAALSMEGVERRCGLTANKFSAYHLADQPSKSSSSTVEKEFPISAPVGFSDQALAIAGTIGVLPLMQHLSVLEAEVVQDKEVTSLHLIQTRQRLSEVRYQLSDLVLSALFQVVNTAAAVHCEEERANLSANHLQELQDKRVVQDTIFAILGGAAVGVVSGGLSLAAYPTAAPSRPFPEERLKRHSDLRLYFSKVSALAIAMVSTSSERSGKVTDSPPAFPGRYGNF